MSVADVSVVIVTFNSGDQIEECLRSLPNECEVIVVDNNSCDNTQTIVAEKFPSVRLIQNELNVGYGAANNQGLKIAARKYALVLNPDMVVKKDAIAKLKQFLDSHPSVVLCGGKLLNQDGTVQQSACNALTLWAVFCEQTRLEKLFPNSKLFSPYWISKRLLRDNSSDPRRVNQVMGACLFLRRANDNFPLFDERYNLYCEDTDLCKRVSKAGEIWYVPEAEFVHALGSSSGSNRHRAVQLYNAGKERYFRIHSGPAAAAICFTLDRLGALLMALVWAFATAITLFAWPRAARKTLLFLRVLIGPIYPKLPQTGP